MEDDEAHVALIRHAFQSEKRPIRFSVAKDLLEARSLIAASSPDIAIIDYRLPDGSGLEIFSENGRDASFPIIIMTSHGDEALAVKSMRSGAFDYIKKSEESFRNMPHICETALREWAHFLKEKAAERAVRESEARFRKIFQHSNDAIFLVDAVRNEIVDANPVACEMLQYAREELLSKCSGGIIVKAGL